MRGRKTSSANFVWPVHLGRASTLRKVLPTTFRGFPLFPFFVMIVGGGACPRPIVSLAERAGTSPAPILIRDQKCFHAAIPSLHRAYVPPPAPRLRRF